MVTFQMCKVTGSHFKKKPGHFKKKPGHFKKKPGHFKKISRSQSTTPQRRRRWCPCSSGIQQYSQQDYCNVNKIVLFFLSIKALYLVGAVSCFQLSQHQCCMNKDKSILTFITYISLRGYNTANVTVYIFINYLNY